MKHAEEIPHKLPRISKRALSLIAVCALASIAVLFILGFWIRHDRVVKREKMAEEMRDRKPVVEVVRPKATEKSFELTLPADVRAYAATSLYARTNGYLASWTVDINDRVKKGDVMAVISAPDTVANLEQAEAALNQQQTNYKLADVTAGRYQGLVATQGVTQQQLDQFNSASDQAKAEVVSAAASVDRLKALVGFEKIIAPFDGVVTARNYDVGALISATNIASGQELFDVAEDDQLRVFVNVPQSYAFLVKYGQDVELLLARNYPGHRFKGLVTRSTGSLDPVTRTLRTELDFKNDDPAGHIFPGMYGEAIFEIHRETPVLTIPTSALLFEADGKQVAVVDRDNKVHFQKISPGNDFGTEIEVLDGLKGDERIVSNPGLGLAEGVSVSPQEAKAEEKRNADASKSSP
jgi:RND family efflux transporter MFP subunit